VSYAANGVVTITCTTTNTYTLSVTLDGSGTVTSVPAGINCGTGCAYGFPQGQSVTLHAAPASGLAFVGWTGSCTGVNDCTLSMTSAKMVTARFRVLWSLTCTIKNSTSDPVDAKLLGDTWLGQNYTTVPAYFQVSIEVYALDGSVNSCQVTPRAASWTLAWFVDGVPSPQSPTVTMDRSHLIFVNVSPSP